VPCGPPLAVPYLPNWLPRDSSQTAGKVLYPAITKLDVWRQHRLWRESEQMYHDEVATISAAGADGNVVARIASLTNNKCCEYASAVCGGLLNVKQHAASHHTPMSLPPWDSDTLPFQGGYIYTVLTLIETIQQRSHR
jgi:hypothetical protein